MKSILTLIISFFILSLSSKAVTLSPQVAKKGSVSSRKVAQTPDSPAEVVQKIVNCIQHDKKIEEIKACTKSYFPKDLAKDERDRLLSWLALPLKLSYPAICPNEKIEFIREEFKEAKAQLLCSDYKLLTHDKTAIFFMTLESGKYTLQNIRK